MRTTLPLSVCCCIAMLMPAAARAEIISFSGSSSVEIIELVDGVTGQTDSDTLDFPGSTTTLPAQVGASVESSDLVDHPSAAAAAAQFADPTTVPGNNPQEFAINMTLNSVSKSIRYRGVGVTRETRQIRFAPGELGPSSVDGAAHSLTGRVTIDGALTIISALSGTDLTQARVRLRVTVLQRDVAGERELFRGSIALAGEGTGVRPEGNGRFPLGRLILSDLSRLRSEFAAFHVLILPNVPIDFTYDVIVGQTSELEVTVQVDARTAADNVGVSAVIGTPSDTLSSVFSTSRSRESATAIVNAILAERADPSGVPAFPDAAPADDPAIPLFALCGPLGVESAVGLLLLGGAARFGVRRRTQNSDAA